MSFKNTRYSSRIEARPTRVYKFLETMDKVIPWWDMVTEINKVRKEKNNTWRPPISTLLLIKIYCLQLWWNISDPGVEDRIYDSISFQRFLDIDITSDRIPDETTICRFRKLLTDNWLQDKMLEIINEKLDNAWLICKEWTIVDATIIEASWSTKNKEEKRDPEMWHTRKREKPYFWMKAHIWVDKKNGIVHTAKYTPANIHDSQMTEELLHWEEREIIWDSWYADEKKRDRLLFREWKNLITCRRAYRNKPLTEDDRIWNRLVSWVRMRVERPFWVIKGLWWHTKLRYKGILKNAMQRTMLFALANIYRMRNKLLNTIIF